MKHSAVHSLQPESRSRNRTGGSRHPVVAAVHDLLAKGRPVVRCRALLATALVVQATACVTSSTHDDVVAQRDALAATVSELSLRAGKLEVSNTSLEAERLKIYDELEDLRVESEALSVARIALEQDVAQLSESKADLTIQLASTSRALTLASENVRDLNSTYQGLVNDLEAELQRGEIEIEQLRSGLRVAVSDDILFQSGSAKLDPAGVEVIKKVAEHIKKLDYAVDVEGHSDDKQIRGTLKKRYPTNWELAGARASSVVRVFESEGIDGTRLQAISRAEFAPVAQNVDDEGRGQNRRIEIRLRPREKTELIDAEGEEAPAAPAAPEGTHADASATSDEP